MSARAALLWFLLLAPVINLLTVLALPYVINAVVMHRIAQRAVDQAQASASTGRTTRDTDVLARNGINVALAAPRADANARTVVRPSPDLLYTACVYDLRAAALRITAPVQESYVSVSGFAADSSNFFALNDRQVPPDASGRRHIDLLLTRDASGEVQPGSQRVLAPSDRGLVLFRSLIADEATLPQLQAEFQAQQSCEPWPAAAGADTR